MDIQVLLKLILSAALGGIIGLEREMAHKRGVMKACVLISVGATLLTVLALYVQNVVQSRNGDISVIIAHLITAVGILAAAALIKERIASRGITTAGIVLCVGTIGVLVGFGLYLTAFIAAVFIVAGLTLINRISNSIARHSTVFTYIISTQDRASVMIEIKKIVLELGLNYVNANIVKHRGGFQIELILNTSDIKNKTFIERVMQLPDVIEINSEHL